MTSQAITMSNTLGEYITREIAQRGWSQRQASDELNVPFTTLNNVIHGRNMPDLPTMRKLADGLKVSIVRLIELAGFGENDTPDPMVVLTNEDRAFIDSLTREELIELVDLARRMKGKR